MLGKLHVLLMDDNPDHLGLMKIVCSLYPDKIEYTSAATIEEAIAAYKIHYKEQPDVPLVAFLDFQMNEGVIDWKKTGLDVLKYIREEEQKNSRKSIPIYLVSIYGNNIHEEALRLGAYVNILKPDIVSPMIMMLEKHLMEHDILGQGDSIKDYFCPICI